MLDIFPILNNNYDIDNDCDMVNNNLTDDTFYLIDDTNNNYDVVNNKLSDDTLYLTDDNIPKYG